jgi:hypothetical protein
VSVHPVPSLLLLGAGAVLLVVAAVLFGRGIRQRRVAEGFRDRAVEVQAEVVGLEAKDVSIGSAPDTRYFLRVRFTPAGGDPVETETMTDAPYPPPRVGEPVAVAYDPEHPRRADLVATERTVDGVGRTSFLLGWLTLAVALATPAAWLVLVFVVWTS